MAIATQGRTPPKAPPVSRPQMKPTVGQAKPAGAPSAHPGLHAAPLRGPSRAETGVGAVVKPRSTSVAAKAAAAPSRAVGHTPKVATAVQCKLRVEGVKGGAELTAAEAYNLVSQFFSYQNEHERRFGKDFRVILRRLVSRGKTQTFSSPGALWEELQRQLLRAGVDIYSWGDPAATKRQMAKSLKAAGRVQEQARDNQPFRKNYSRLMDLHAVGPKLEGVASTKKLFRRHLTSQLGRDLGLNRHHELALYGYSQPDKNDENKAHYMFESESWGRYGTGWKALEEALSILPSFGQLGVTAPVFRVEREDSVFMKVLSTCWPPVYVYHGFGRMPSGQRHQLSAGMISSVHVNTDARKRGVLKFHVKSARYINAWGGMSPVTDGAEVLIPAGTITLFKGQSSARVLDDKVDTVFTLVEQDPKNLDPNIRVIEDHTGKDVSAQVHTHRPTSSTTSSLLGGGYQSL